MLQVPRWCLNILASRKGLVIGPISFDVKTDHCDASNMPRRISCNQDELSNFSTRADFILLVEKDSFFAKLVAEELHKELNCIIITG
jgi:DNA topoisomerase VI subunit A